jgi:hypothetical protein
MDFGTYLWRLLQYAFWNPSNPFLSPIAWVACLWALFTGVVPHVNRLRHLQQPLRRISKTWRVLILVLLILGSVIVAAYSMQNGPILILSQRGTIVIGNTTAIINFYVENIGGNPAYDIGPSVCWAPESKPQYLSSPGMQVVKFYLYPGEEGIFPFYLSRTDFFGNDSDRWYIYYRLKYSDARNIGVEYTQQYWYLFDFNTRSLSELSPTQKQAFQPYVDELFAD